MSLAEKLEPAWQPWRSRMVELIEQLSVASRALDAPLLAERLEAWGAWVKLNDFQVMVLGRFMTGKSTLIQALLGSAIDHTGTGEHDTIDLGTLLRLHHSAPVTIRHREHLSLRVWHDDGTWRDYAREALDDNVRGAGTSFLLPPHTRELELGLPLLGCGSGLRILHYPGLDYDQGSEDHVELVATRCDAAIMVYRSDAFAGLSERQVAQRLINAGQTHVFTVVNLVNDRRVDARFQSFVWDRLVTGVRGGPKAAGQDLITADIYMVDCRAALAARLAGDEEAATRAGLVDFEQRLADFLIDERFPAYRRRVEMVTRRFAQEAEQLAAAGDVRPSLLSQIHARISAAVDALPVTN